MIGNTLLGGYILRLEIQSSVPPTKMDYIPKNTQNSKLDKYVYRTRKLDQLRN